MDIHGELPEVRGDILCAARAYEEKFYHFDEEGNLLLHVTAREDDLLFDEIGSVLKIKEIQAEKRELLEALELYYRAVFLGEDVSGLLEEDE